MYRRFSFGLARCCPAVDRPSTRPSARGLRFGLYALRGRVIHGRCQGAVDQEEQDRKVPCCGDSSYFP
jgi:hypothetical protein